MRDRRDPWKWPFALVAAVALTIGLFLYLPAAWIDSLFSYPGPADHAADLPPARWITLLPPPDIALIPEPETDAKDKPDPPEIPFVREDPRWWSEGWQVQTGIAVSRDLAPTSADSVAVLLQELGLGLDFLSQARPDSVLAARLTLMQVEDSMRFDELKPYLSAMTRARAFRDMKSREADMYDDHLQSEIIVPN